LGQVFFVPRSLTGIGGKDKILSVLFLASFALFFGILCLAVNLANNAH
jgi:hypothetical protein